MEPVSFGAFDKEIEADASRVAKLADRRAGNFEDQLRAATDLLRGLEILGNAVEGEKEANDGGGGEGYRTGHAAKSEGSGADAETRNALRKWDPAEKAAQLRAAVASALDEFAGSILTTERDLVAAAEARRNNAFNHLVSFLLSFASRSGTRERLHLFTTNYDRFLEAGAEAAGLRLIDRFVGTLEPVFRSSRLDVDLHYNPPGIRGEPRYLEGVARFTKLHGSVDWLDCGEAIRRVGLPFGAGNLAPYLSAPGRSGVTATQLMVYPNAAKDRETASHPYVELFRDLAAAICRPNSTLVCYGYGFGDEHINRVIGDMLTIPSTHLVVLSYDDPLGRIMKTYEAMGRGAQATLLIGNHLGSLPNLVKYYLPKPAIDRTTFRMADLLRNRFGPTGEERAAKPAQALENGGAE